MVLSKTFNITKIDHTGSKDQIDAYRKDKDSNHIKYYVQLKYYDAINK
jgi:hypothetical protein